MKKILSVILLCVIIVVAVAGCGKSERLLYNVDLADYIKLGEYKDLEIDFENKNFLKYYNSAVYSDASDGGFIEDVTLTEGIVKLADTVNIDYEGKKDGIAFEGGTAKGYDLAIGSGSFIDGFEDGLIGAQIGSTIDLNLTFPEDYGNEELNGANVVFTVKVNSISKRAKEMEEYYKDLGFKSLEEYKEDLKVRAKNSYVVNNVVSEAEVLKYPEEDVKKIYDFQAKMINLQYNMDLESFFEATNMNEKSFMNSYIYPQVKQHMVFYAILDKEKISCTEEEVNEYIEEIAKNSEGLTVETLKENYEEFYFESLLVSEKVSDYLYENNKVK